MGWRIRKSFGRGVRLNVSKGGVSVSTGVRGLTWNSGQFRWFGRKSRAADVSGSATPSGCLGCLVIGGLGVLVIGFLGSLSGQPKAVMPAASDRQMPASPTANLSAAENRPTSPQRTPPTLSTGSVRVSREQFGDRWPLTLQSGYVECVGISGIVFRTNDGRLFALNGTAKGHGYPEIDPIWLDDPAYAGRAGLEGIKIDISPLIDVGLDLWRKQRTPEVARQVPHADPVGSRHPMPVEPVKVKEVEIQHVPVVNHERQEQAAASRLNLAKQLKEKGKLAAAKSWLEKLLEEFPETAAAREAENLLKSLPQM